MSSVEDAYASVIPAQAGIQQTLLQRFAASLQALGPFTPTSHFAVALSGGADSLALALLLQDYCAQHGGRITALTVDHRLRAESTAEAQTVAAMMQERGIEHHILTPQHSAVSNNLQEAARAWRYDALSDYCRTHGILHCLVAHTAGDNRETVQHNLTRGDTADGASGMRAARNYRGVRFLRPLLSVERAELETYLRAEGATWIEDPSNQNQKFARVRTRQMLQRDDAARAMLDATMVQHRTARSARDAALAQAAVRCVTLHPLGFAEVDVAAWRALDATLASQLLADCIVTIGGGSNRPRAADTARLCAALNGNFSKRTLGQCEVSLSGGMLRIARELARVAPAIPLSGSGETRWDGRFTVRYQLPEGTDYTIAALGIPGRKQVRERWKLDLPAASPALWHLDEVQWLPHIELPHVAHPQVTIGFSPPKPLAAAAFW